MKQIENIILERVSLKARVNIDTNGHIEMTPYNTGSGSRYTPIIQTTHGALSESQSCYHVKLTLPKRMGVRQAALLIIDEATTMAEYLHELDMDD